MNNFALAVPAALNSAIDILLYGVLVGGGVTLAAVGFYRAWTDNRRRRR